MDTKTEASPSKTKSDTILNLSSKSPEFTVLDITLIVLSMSSIVADMLTDLVIVVDYFYHDYKMWALGTFFLIIFPSIIVQTFSIRWHMTDNTFSSYHWISHICLLGILHRYYRVLQVGLEARKSRSPSDFEKLFSYQSDLGILHLFESFLEAAPQLVLQLYIILMLKEWRLLTGLSAAASLFSLAWALASYSRAQRIARPEKNSVSWMGLLLQASWRVGMLGARITALVIFAYCFRSWIFLFLFFHWIAMTVWIIHQKTDLCDTQWEEKIYNGVAGVIYCFCFFNLQEGHSRWKALTFYLVIIFQNLLCLTIFLMWFAGKTPKLAITAFVTIIGGSTIGIVSMLLYYRFFHPSGPIEFCINASGENSKSASPVRYAPSVHSSSNTNTLRSLKHMWYIENEPPTSVQSSPLSEDNCNDDKVLLNTTPLRAHEQLTDSIVIMEENVLEDSDVDIKVLQSWMEETECKQKSTGEHAPQKYKRRAICSSVDLNQLMESKDDKTETESNTSLKLVGTDEAPSEVLSAHDYENICAVNIAREAWGLRSWRGYSDIESWLHDDSVVRDRRRDTLTSASSEHSATTATSGESLQRKIKETRTRQDDYMDTLVDDLVECHEVEDIYLPEAEHYNLDSLGIMFPSTTLDTILEELEISSTSTGPAETKPRRSTLVATIDEIRRNTPIHSQYASADCVLKKQIVEGSPKAKKKLEMLEPEEVLFLSQLTTSASQLTYTSPHKVIGNTTELAFPVNRISPESIEMNESYNNSLEDDTIKKAKQNRPRRKFSLIRERFEPKLTDSTTDLMTSNESLNCASNNTVEIKVVKFSPCEGKENIPTVASKINYWDKIVNNQHCKPSLKKIEDDVLPRKVAVKEKKNVFLKQVLTPQKLYGFRKKSISPKSKSPQKF